MTFGAAYAGIYDALYCNKDYAAESAFVLRQLRGYLPESAATILDLGCGTGLHAVEMAKAGHHVTGLDRSTDMIVKANARAKALPSDIATRLVFETGDILTADQGHTFSAVVSLFHVMCYMTTDKDMRLALATARRHVRPLGAFLFDFWHADAVLNDPPQRRERAIVVEGRQIIRTTTPHWEPQHNLVHITYDVKDVVGDDIAPPETHSIRYFHRQELVEYLGRAGFEVLRFGEWLTDAEPSKDSFGVYCIARAR